MCDPNLTTYRSQQVRKIQSRLYTKIKRCYWRNLPGRKEKKINTFRNHKVTYLCAIVNYFSLRPQVFLSANIQHISAWTCVTNLINVIAASCLYVKVYLLASVQLTTFLQFPSFMPRMRGRNQACHIWSFCASNCLDHK